MHDFTTAPKRTHDIVDTETGETAGQAPGIDARDALETFQRDALHGHGNVLTAVEAADLLGLDGPALYVEGQGGADIYRAQLVESAGGDGENGPHADEIAAARATIANDTTITPAEAGLLIEVADNADHAAAVAAEADDRDDRYEIASADVAWPLSTADATTVADALELLAGIDEGENTDYAALMRLCGDLRRRVPTTA